MTNIATICARGGSVGVPGKNLKPLLGKPLIAYTIECALAAPCIDEVFVSTDDPRIQEVAIAYGAKVPFLRPAELATHQAAKLPVIEHLVNYLEDTGVSIDKIIDLDPTSPLRLVEDISACYELLTEDVDVVITAYESDKNPYFNMVELDESGTAKLVKPMPNVVARQMAPTVFAMNASIYVWHRHSLSKGLWDGNTNLYEMPRERSIDIDEPLDFEIVELLMKQRQSKCP